ncbi:MAG: DUF4159 domain-containing protein, partial [Planctomycetota bacterium]|nr:DUF4159 domain-containing protein [Planctomycetota bacterium]
MKQLRPAHLHLVASLLALLSIFTPHRPAIAQQPDAESATEIRVAMLTYAEGVTGRCFSDDFLDLLEYETSISVANEFTSLPLHSESIFEHPFAVMTGEGTFHLRDDEIDLLRSYLARGGFILASAGCSNASWAASMRRTIERLFPDVP